MKRKQPAATVVFSPVPLARELREFYANGPAIFVDLASVRRGGLSETLRNLRSHRASRVVVTGDETDLHVFRDVLSLLVFAIPASERWYAPRGRDPIPLGWSSVPVAAGRIGFGIGAGLKALSANSIRLRRIAARDCGPRIIEDRMDRCLYLKSALNFGALVGGSVGHVAGVANALVRSGIGMKIVAVATQPMVDPGIPQIIVGPDPITAYPHELNLFRYHRTYLSEVLRQVSEFRPGFIYQRYSLNDMSGIFLRRRMGIPLILEYNGSETWIQRHWGKPLRFQSISERIEKANLRYADLIVVVSEEIKRQVVEEGIPEERVLCYPNCIDASIFDPDRFDVTNSRRVRQQLGIPVEADLFTFIGTFGQWHGTVVLASAIRRLVESDRAFLEANRIRFLLVGDGMYGEQVRSMLKGLPFVTLPGYRPQAETPSILAASDVCLSPHVPNPDGTPFFGSPTKLFEYMAMAKTIVASDLDQIGWVLRGWRPGEAPPAMTDRTDAAAILVEPGDLDSLIEGIRSAARMNSAERSRLGERARNLALESFTWDKNVSAVRHRFEKLLYPKSRTEKAPAEIKASGGKKASSAR